MRSISLLLALSLPAVQGKPSQDEIRALVEKLRSDAIEEREEAARKLEEAGKRAIPALRKAARDRDAEVASRSGLVLRRIEIREKIPPKVLAALPGVEKQLAELHGDVWITLLNEAVSKETAPPLDLDDLAAIGSLIVREAKTPQERMRVCSKLKPRLIHHVCPGILAWLDDGAAKVRSAVLDKIDHLYFPAALPQIVALLEDPDPSLRWNAVSALGWMGVREPGTRIVRLLKDPVKRVRHSAAWSVGRLRVKEAIPLLLELFDEEGPKVDQSVLHALGKLGAKEALPRILDLLDHESEFVRREACWAIEYMRAPEAWPALVKLLEEETNYPVIEHAERALIALGAEAATPKLVELLRHKEVGVRASAMQVLVRMGARKASPLIVPLLNGNDAPVTVISALAELEAYDAAPKIAPFLQHQSKEIRRAAAWALGLLGHREAVPALMKLLKDSDPYVRGTAAEALGRLEAPEALPELVALLEDDNMIEVSWGSVSSWLGTVGQFSQEALSEWGTKEAIRPLLDALEKRPGARFYAAQVIGALGAREAIPTLRKLLKEEDPGTRMSACLTLGKLGAVSAAGEIEKLLEDKDYRSTAIEALADMNHREVAPRIARFLEDRSWYVRKAAVQALCRLNAAGVAPKLARRLKDTKDEVRSAAAEALGRLEAREQVDALSALLTDFDRQVRLTAASWLCALGSRRGVPLLLDSGEELVFLNALRNPAQWQRLTERRLEYDLRGSAPACWGRLADETDLELDGFDVHNDGDRHWIPRGSSLLDVARRVAQKTDRAIVLERGRLIVLPRPEALEFWNDWWSEEQRKQPKK